MNKRMASFLIRTFAFAIFCFLLIFTFAAKINLTNSDIGRHLMNGKVVVDTGKVFDTNLYSYTHQNYPAINHHWLSGVIFFFVFQASGFDGLSLFYLLLLISGFLFFVFTSMRTSGFWLSLVTATICLPLLANRIEIRPEGISAFFLGLYFCLLMLYRHKDISWKWLCVLPVVQILWVNSHIFFIMGPFLMTAFLIDAWLNQRGKTYWKPLLIVLIITGISCLMNPKGFMGMLVPFNIFKEYGYLLAENMSVFFMMERFPDNPLYLYYLIVLMIAITLLCIKCYLKGWKGQILFIILLGFFGLLGIKTIRAMSVCALFLAPFMAMWLKDFLDTLPEGWRKYQKIMIATMSLVLMITALLWVKPYFSPVHRHDRLIKKFPEDKSPRFWQIFKRPAAWLGLLPNNHLPGKFLQQYDIRGPIFNNYDVGGYLTFFLFPKEKVFVDNRPEAYPVEFFQEEFIPMQEDNDMWQKANQKYRFNVIVFYRHDYTPWGQNFLIERVQDLQWAPVFVDRYTIIFLKRNPINAPIIQKYELPKDLFSIKKNN